MENLSQRQSYDLMGNRKPLIQSKRFQWISKSLRSYSPQNSYRNPEDLVRERQVSQGTKSSNRRILFQTTEEVLALPKEFLRNRILFQVTNKYREISRRFLYNILWVEDFGSPLSVYLHFCTNIDQNITKIGSIVEYSFELRNIF